MQCDNAAAHALERDTGEARFPHHPREARGRGEAADRFHEIAVGLRIPGDDAAERGDDVEGVEIVERIEPGNVDGRELEAEKTSADAQHAMRLGKRGCDPRHVADTERNGDSVEAASAKRQALGVALDEGCSVAVRAQPRPAHLQHLGVDVEDGHAGAGPAPGQHAGSHITGAAGDIEQRKGPLARGRIDGGDEGVLPGAMQPAGHQIVHQIVAIGHAPKHVIDQPLLVPDRYLAEAEIGGCAAPLHGELPLWTRTIAPGCGGRYVCRRSPSTMPELPEVETVRRGLAPVMQGARFTRVEAQRGDLRWPLPGDFVQRLQGQRVERLERRAKYLLAELSSGEVLIMHLGMSGSFHVAQEAASRAPGGYYHARPRLFAHDHVKFHMSSGALIAFNDPRRFGMMKLVARAELDHEPLLRALGPEPLAPERPQERL